MSKDIKDYLHLYLGCTVYNSAFPMWAWELQAVENITQDIRVKLSVIIGSNDGPYPMDGWYLPDKIKPLLRPLSDMREEEYSAWVSKSVGDPQNASVYFAQTEAAKTKYLLSKGFDLFGLIESGLAIDKITLTPPIHPE